MLKSFIRHKLTTEDLILLVDLADLNNCDLQILPRNRISKKRVPFVVEKKKSPYGLTYTLIRVARDLTEHEYKKLTEAINPEYQGDSIEEVLVKEGIRSLQQIANVRLEKFPEQEKRKRIQHAIKKTRSILENAKAKKKVDAKAKKQVKALLTLQESLYQNLSFIEYDGSVIRRLQSPYFTLRHLDAHCEQRTILAYAILTGLAHDKNDFKLYPVFVNEDHRGIGAGHSCLLCELADGSYFIFDAMIPSASGHLTKRELDLGSIPQQGKKKPTTIRIKQERYREKGLVRTRFHRKLSLLMPVEHILSEQYSTLGSAHNERGEVKLAFQAYRRALKINPEFPNAHYNMGEVYLENGRVDSAIREFKNAIELCPRFAEAHYNLALQYHKLKKYSNAIHAYKKSIRINPRIYQAHNNLGNIYYKKKEYAKAVREYRKSLRIDPESEVAHIGLGNVYDKRGKNKAAIREYKKAVLIKPKDAVPYYNLGLAYKKAGKNEEAIRECEKAVHLDTESADLYYDIGVLYNKLGNTENALTAYRTFLKKCRAKKYGKKREKTRKYIQKHGRKKVVFRQAETRVHTQNTILMKLVSR